MWHWRIASRTSGRTLAWQALYFSNLSGLIRMS